MARAFINLVGSVLIGLFLWELVKMALWGVFIMLLIRILGGDWSFLRMIWQTAGWMGVAAFFLFYILLAIRKVESHLGRYEQRILNDEGEDE
jgi:hypothetical protein